MDYSTFYDIAEYGNTAWKGSFTPREIAENAYNYKSDFDWSIANEEVSHTIKELAKLLAEDGSEECMDWLYEMAKELGLLDMDYMDYMETDPEIIARMWNQTGNKRVGRNVYSILLRRNEYGKTDYYIS